MQRAAIRKTTAALVALLAVGALALTVREVVGSDHVDTAEVELSPALDLNDVYAFPGSEDDRIVLVMTVGSPISRMSEPRFDGNALYQFRVDNSGDAVEDLVIQVLFDDMSDGTQQVHVLGPAAPPATGMNSSLVDSEAVSGTLGETFTAGDMQVFAGERVDPFYLDFEQVVRILPDRRPATFLNDISEIGRATAFRPDQAECNEDGDITGDAGPFDPNHGCAQNLFTGARTLAIVIELPESALNAPAGSDGSIGIWSTISR